MFFKAKATHSPYPGLDMDMGLTFHCRHDDAMHGAAESQFNYT